MVRLLAMRASRGILARLLTILALSAPQLWSEPVHAESLYVSRDNGTITSIDTATLAETTFVGTGLSLPEGMVFDRSGNLYVAEIGRDEILRFTPDGVGSVFADGGKSGLLDQPIGLAIDAAGNVYAANYHTITRFTPDGVGSIFASLPQASIDGLAFDRSGNLYAGDGINAKIWRFTPDGVGSVFAGSAYDPDEGLAFDSSGNLYAACFGTDKIVRFTPDGVGSIFASTGLNGPDGLAFDGLGNLYVANYYSSTIERFTPDGIGSVFETGTADARPSFLAFQSVPEPSSLVLMGTAGLFLLACSFWQVRHVARPERACSGSQSKIIQESLIEP